MTIYIYIYYIASTISRPFEEASKNPTFCSRGPLLVVGFDDYQLVNYSFTVVTYRFCSGTNSGTNIFYIITIVVGFVVVPIVNYSFTVESIAIKHLLLVVHLCHSSPLAGTYNITDYTIIQYNMLY